LGDELDLRDLQKTGRMGRIEVDINSKKGKSDGHVLIPSSLDQVETAILASALETIDRIGPCRAKINIDKIEDVRITKKQKIVERAKELLSDLLSGSKESGMDLTESVRQAVQIDEVVLLGDDKCPAGPNVDSSDAIILVEGRSDVINLLKYGIKNAVALGGTNIPETIVKLSNEKVVTAFVDGDRGGQLILKELFQIAEIDFVAKAPKSLEVEELTQKQIIKALRNKIPLEQFLEMTNHLQEGFSKNGGPRNNKERDDRKKNVRKREQRAKEPERKTGEKKEVPQTKDAPTKKDMIKPPKKEDAGMPAEVSRYRDILKTLSGTLKAMLLNTKGEVVKEMAVRQLADTLKTPPSNIHAVVFDGIISQRLLDIAAETKIKFLVGSKKGNLTKEPEGVLVLSKEDLNM
jgi:DNA primase